MVLIRFIPGHWKAEETLVWNFRRLFSRWDCEPHVCFGITLNFSLVCPVSISSGEFWAVWRYQSDFTSSMTSVLFLKQQDAAQIQPFSKGLEQEFAPQMKFDSFCIIHVKWPNRGCSLLPSPDIRWEGGQAQPGGLGRQWKGNQNWCCRRQAERRKQHQQVRVEIIYFPFFITISC